VEARCDDRTLGGDRLLARHRERLRLDEAGVERRVRGVAVAVAKLSLA
jgi:hypothetical protein